MRWARCSSAIPPCPIFQQQLMHHFMITHPSGSKAIMTRSRSNTTGAQALDAGRTRGRHALRYAPLASAISAIIAGGMPLAHAAGEEDTGALQEIVVTAQKKSENLQNVPISISVFDTKKLAQLSITDVDSYVKYSPSMSYCLLYTSP